MSSAVPDLNYLPSSTASMFFGRYQIILLSFKYLCVNYLLMSIHNVTVEQTRREAVTIIS